MSDIRGIPRRSKTAVVVVLVVFLQMLALAVVGIGAIKEDRERGRQQRLEENKQAAFAAMDGAREKSIQEVLSVVNQALDADSWKRLRSDRARWPEPLVVNVFLVHEDGFVYWFNQSEYLLYQPPEATQAQSRLYERMRVRWRTHQSAIKSAASGAPAKRLELITKALREFPVLIDGTETGYYPLAAGWAYQLYDQSVLVDAARTIHSELTQAQVREPVLQSLVVQGLNTGRPEIGPIEAAMVRGIRRQALSSLDKIPEELLGDLPIEVGEFLEHRDFLTRPENLTQFRAFVDAGIEKLNEQAAMVGPYLNDAGPYLFAMSPRSDRTHYSVARLDAAALSRMLSRHVQRTEEVELRRLGMDLRLQAAGGPVDEPLRVQAIEDGSLRLPYELVLYKVRDVVGEGEGRSEVWYWGIIALAALGLLFGALILVRLWRREVRLAQLKADFVSNLSHELKTPLTSISLFTEMLQDGKLDDSPEDQAEAYAVLDQEAQRLQRIVQRMIETARNEAQGVPYQLAAGDLNRVVLAAADRFRRIVTEPGLDLRISLATEPLPMMLDAPAMDDAVTNLLSNAWKYKRGDSAQIAISTVRKGRHAEVVVQDDGIGIPRGERKRVFETFYRSEQYLTQPVQGTGLGLALVRTIVRAHRGRIRLGAGEDGVGTVIRMRFPLSRKAALITAEPTPADDNPPAPNEENRAGARSPEGVGNTGAGA